MERRCHPWCIIHPRSECGRHHCLEMMKTQAQIQHLVDGKHPAANSQPVLFPLWSLASPHQHPNSPPSSSAAMRARVEIGSPGAHHRASAPVVLLHLGGEEPNQRNLEEREESYHRLHRGKRQPGQALGLKAACPPTLILLSATTLHTNAPSMQGWGIGGLSARVGPGCSVNGR